MSLEDSLKQATHSKENAKKSKKPNTLDCYFSSKAPVDVKSKKRKISVDDFFGDSETKKQRESAFATLQKNDNLKTPPRMPTPATPDTPMLSSDDLIPDTPDVLDRTKSPRTPKEKIKSTNHSPIKPNSPKVVEPSISVSTPLKKDSPQSKSESRPSGNRVPFWAYQSREGPRALGSREIPKGTPDCLKGKTFLITGILECIERDDAHALIERCGGKVMKTLGKKTGYLIVGREAGAGKLAKAEVLKTKQLNEDEFLNMISELCNEQPVSKIESPQPKATPSKNEAIKKQPTPQKKVDHSTTSSTKKKEKREEISLTDTKSPSKTLTAKPVVTKPSQADRPQLMNIDFSALSTGHELWVDKYRPTSLRTLIGQSGANSPANRLYTWLSSWHSNFSSGAKARAYSSAPPWATGMSDDGAWARAALLSGLPGIGKTSSAMIVCRELGFTTCELNASDCRSKRSLQEEISQTLGMQNLKQMACGEASHLSRDRHVLIMDEVDGMAGNEDRGGMQELINMIKSSRIPVICICNDRQSPKVINNTQMWCVGKLANESQLVADASGARKDVRLSAFEVIRKVFAPDVSGQNGRQATLNECLDLFFQDYSIIPLFVQENYLNVRPKSAQGNPNRTLQLLAEASKNIAMGDVVSKAIRSAGTGSWSLLPTQGILSTVMPGHILCGPLPGGVGPGSGVSFPSWFGKNSNQNRMRRVSCELSSHMNLATHGSSSNPRNLVMEYASVLSESLTRPLKEEIILCVVDHLSQNTGLCLPFLGFRKTIPFKKYRLKISGIEPYLLNVRLLLILIYPPSDVYHRGNPNRTLQLLAEASKNIAMGDVVSKAIRSAGTGSWSLLPTQGILSTVMPGHILCGPLPGGVGPGSGVSFPSWFGKNSNQNRMRRVSCELSSHMNLATHGSSSNPRNLVMEYASVLSESLTRPLKEGDTDRVLQTLIHYNLQREDLDAILELATWSNRPNRMQGIDGKAKAALTRAFNKSTHLLPYSTIAMGKVRSKRADPTGQDLAAVGPDVEDADGLFDTASPDSSGEDLQEDAMIARKATKPRVSTSSSKSGNHSSCAPAPTKRSQSSARGRAAGKPNSRKKTD
ncbi:Replication factor C subunit 1 [Fasciola gigantica]|uniref:Replication factor C subunit 1 n=1 Tax=Fasciola gigantica TaxID=46835 RepID=A0A504YPC4_FASGI|nr:Replication factor C subunit 1 [Fasciola gigantica]